MRRADRLFRLVEHLKARRQVVTGRGLADALEVSLRTVYRDVADLVAAGTPIIGEAGVGYLLDKDHVLRPLTFGVEELDALMLGAQMVESWGDDGLRRAARSALDKVRSVLPGALAQESAETFLLAFPTEARPAIGIDFARLRRAIRTRHRIRFDYADAAGQRSARTARPLSLVFFAPAWLLLAWCELRQDFRNFRLDRMAALEIAKERFPVEQGKRLRDYLARLAAERRPAPDG